MATLRTRWLLSIVLVNVSNGFAGAAAPDPPSPPDCYIPCAEINCSVDIHCTWDQRPDPQFPTNYSLHWEQAKSKESNVTSGTSLSAIIHRHHFSSVEDVRVWVWAKNQHGSAKSPENKFNIADINKPPPPKVTGSHEDPFEIKWNSICQHPHLSMGTCYVRQRAEDDKAWHEDEHGSHPSYTFDNPQPCTVYEFQVRCSCEQSLKSAWSEVHRIQSTDAAPVGELDVWRDCGLSPASSDCVLTWKKLSTSQACGVILGYEVKLFYDNGIAESVNVSAAEPAGVLKCDETQCHLSSSLKGASSVSVSAYNAHGAAVPSYLTMPMPGVNCPDCLQEKNHQDIRLNMNEETVTASWNVSSQLSDNLREYVVQYKQAGCLPGRRFDWVRVNKSQTSATFKGQFENYTAYQVSVFAVSHSNEVRHLSSAVGCPRQGIPPVVPSLKVLDIAATYVTLFWKTIPLSEQNGVIEVYEIGVNGPSLGQNAQVNNKSVPLQHENTTFVLLNLSPGQDYEVWVGAVTGAGRGENATTTFKTKDQEDYAYITPLVLGILFVIFVTFVICFAAIFISACRQRIKACPLVPLCLYEKVPDPGNSHIFKQMKYQMNDPFVWICIPVYEPHPKISLLEVVQIQPCASKSSLEKTSDTDGLTRSMVGDRRSQIDFQHDQREDAATEECRKTDHKDRRKAYSRMVDSDEERDREEEEEEEVHEDCWSSSEEEQCTSGYEKHFMPTASEILV